MTLRLLLTALAVLSLAAPGAAQAVTGDDTAPGTACSVDKAVQMTANPSGSGGYVLTCEGGKWVATLECAATPQPTNRSQPSAMSTARWRRALSGLVWMTIRTLCALDNPAARANDPRTHAREY